MSDSGELLKKADALLGRYRGGARGPDSDFPVLTEVVEPQQGSAPPQPAHGKEDASPSPVIPAAQLRELEARVIRQVKQRVESYLASELDQPLRERLDVYLSAAHEAVAGQMRVDLESMVQTAVSEAIAQALADLREAAPPDAG
jgi:DNA-binding transcriptional MocR family regulator